MTRFLALLVLLLTACSDFGSALSGQDGGLRAPLKASHDGAGRTEPTMSHTPMNGVVDVYCIGDATTFGDSIDAPVLADKNAYRQFLNLQLNADRVAGDIPGGLTFSWVGNTISGAAPTDHHDGIVGASTASQFITMLGQIQDTALVPDSQAIVIVPIGTVDSLTGPATAAFQANYMSLIRRIHNLLRPKSPRFLFVKIIESNANAITINGLLPDIWTELGRETIEYESASWQYPGFNATPRQVQYNQMANLGPGGRNLWQAFRALVGYPVTPTWTDLVGWFFGESTTRVANFPLGIFTSMVSDGRFRMYTVGSGVDVPPNAIPVPWTAIQALGWQDNDGWSGTTFTAQNTILDAIIAAGLPSTITDPFNMTGINEALTNDYSIPAVFAASQARYVTILNKIKALTPNARKRFAITPNMSTGVTLGPRLVQWNAALPALVASVGGFEPVIDLMAGPNALTAADISGDGVHPNAGGYAKMGLTVYANAYP